MTADQTARLRAHEIVLNSQQPITLQEAYATVYQERFGDDVKAILRELAKQAAGSSKALVRSTWVLPDSENDQLTLLDIPAVIAVDTPDGPLFIQRPQATARQVLEWLENGERHHSTQKYRFKNGRKDVTSLVRDDELDKPWPEVRRLMIERKQNMIEGAA